MAAVKAMKSDARTRVCGTTGNESFTPERDLHDTRRAATDIIAGRLFNLPALDYRQRIATPHRYQDAMRAFVVSLLAVLVVALSQMTGTVRAEASPSDMQVLCSDLGAVAVVMGPDGTPEAPVKFRHCPDCYPLPQPSALTGPVDLPAAVWTAAVSSATGDNGPRSLPSPCQIPAARGPPRVS